MDRDLEQPEVFENTPAKSSADVSSPALGKARLRGASVFEERRQESDKHGTFENMPTRSFADASTFRKASSEIAVAEVVDGLEANTRKPSQVGADPITPSRRGSLGSESSSPGNTKYYDISPLITIENAENTQYGTLGSIQENPPKAESKKYNSDDKSSGKIFPWCTNMVCLGGLVGGICFCIFIYILIGIIGGRFFVYRPVEWGWMEGLTACDKYFCGPDDGPYLTPQNFTRRLRWGGLEPTVGYKTNAVVDNATCYSPKQLYDMEAFNAAAGWEAVYYNSRPDPEGKAETVRLMAWLLKTPKRRFPHLSAGSAPRVVVQHGVGSNQNDLFTNYIAYDLRSMGFDVLVPGFRNHGWSGKSKHDRTTWGWVYPLDLLAGWDYAVNDPEGKFGGAVDPKSVGVVGISMGAMTASTAFGMEKRLHAAFIDSGPADPYNELETQMIMVPNTIRAMLMPIVWWGAEWWTGVDLGRYTPKKQIPCDSAPYMRHAAVVASSKQNNEMVDLLASHPHCYVLDTVFFPRSDCQRMSHGSDVYLSPDLYRLHLCSFFTKAFNLPCDYCKMDTLPWYDITDKVAQEKAIYSICGNQHHSTTSPPL